MKFGQIDNNILQSYIKHHTSDTLIEVLLILPATTLVSVSNWTFSMHSEILHKMRAKNKPYASLHARISPGSSGYHHVVFHLEYKPQIAKLGREQLIS